MAAEETFAGTGQGGRPGLNGRAETPPRPPRESEPDPTGCVHHFHAEGQDWVARIAGKGAAGTGSYGLGLMDAVHFAAAVAPDRPLREALIARGRFVHLFEEELRTLLARATPIVTGERPAGQERQRGR